MQTRPGVSEGSHLSNRNKWVPSTTRENERRLGMHAMHFVLGEIKN